MRDPEFDAVTMAVRMYGCIVSMLLHGCAVGDGRQTCTWPVWRSLLTLPWRAMPTLQYPPVNLADERTRASVDRVTNPHGAFYLYQPTHIDPLLALFCRQRQGPCRRFEVPVVMILQVHVRATQPTKPACELCRTLIGRESHNVRIGRTWRQVGRMCDVDVRSQQRA